MCKDVAVFSLFNSRRSARTFIEKLFSTFDVRINGDRPWDICVNDERFFTRMIANPSLGLGESYIDGWWTCDDMEELFFRFCRGGIERIMPRTLPLAFLWLQSVLVNRQTRERSKKVARKHYDLGNDLFESFLDPYMQYSCGYYKDTDDLNTAQLQKLDLQCRKLMLKPGDKVLDIGCGWGGFAKYAAARYGCHVTGITISQEQAEYARTFCVGLPVDIQLYDYRDLSGLYDKVLSCGMIEHVGAKNYRIFMRKVNDCLSDNGIFLLHTITNSTTTLEGIPWIEKYIFPNSIMPSFKQIIEASEGLFVPEDWHNFGAHYRLTLLAWHKNFIHNWPKISHVYGERFKRTWEFYLLSCAGAFHARVAQLTQVVFTKQGLLEGYTAPR